MTEYLILESINDQGTQFAIVGEQQAQTSTQAITKFVHQQEGEGIFAAVPKRYWTAVELTARVQRLVEVTPL